MRLTALALTDFVALALLMRVTRLATSDRARLLKDAINIWTTDVVVFALWFLFAKRAAKLVAKLDAAHFVVGPVL